MKKLLYILFNLPLLCSGQTNLPAPNLTQAVSISSTDTVIVVQQGHLKQGAVSLLPFGSITNNQSLPGLPTANGQGFTNIQSTNITGSTLTLSGGATSQITGTGWQIGPGDSFYYSNPITHKVFSSTNGIGYGDGSGFSNIVAGVTNLQSLSTNFFTADSQRVADRDVGFYGVNRFMWPHALTALQKNAPFTLWFFGNGWIWDSVFDSTVTNFMGTRPFAGFGSVFRMTAPTALSYGFVSGSDTVTGNNGLDTNWMPPYIVMLTNGSIASPVLGANLTSLFPGSITTTGGSPLSGDTIRVVYMANPTGGLFNVEVRTNGAGTIPFTDVPGSWSNIASLSSTNATWKAIVYQWTNSFSGPLQFRVRATTDGYTPILDVGQWDSTITNGLILGMYAHDAMGNPPQYTQQYTNNSAKVLPVWNADNPTAVIYGGGTGDTNDNTWIPTLYTMLRTGFTNADIIDAGVHDASVNEGVVIETRLAYTNNVPFFQGSKITQDAWGSFIHAGQIGMIDTNNSPHLTTLGYNSFGEMVWCWLGWVDTFPYPVTNATATVYPSAVVTQGFSSAMTFSNNVTVDPAHQLNLLGNPISSNLVLFCHPTSGFVQTNGSGTVVYGSSSGNNGASVQYWRDASGNGNDLVSASGSQLAALGNGLSSCVYFPFAQASYFTVPAGVALSSTNQSVFIVFSPDVFDHVNNLGGGLWSPTYLNPSILNFDQSPGGLNFAGGNFVYYKSGASAPFTPLFSQSGIQIGSMVSSSTNMWLSLGGIEQYSEAPTTSTNTTGGFIGNFNNSYYYKGRMYAVLIYSRALSSDEVFEIQNWANQIWGIQNQVAQISIAADSISAGYGCSNRLSWVKRIALNSPRYNLRNYSVTGSTFAQWTNIAAQAYLNIVSNALDTNYSVKVGAIWLGSNDAANTVTNIQNWFTNLATTMRLIGYNKIIVSTVLPRNLNATNEWCRTNYNQWLRLNYTNVIVNGQPTADVLIDPASDPIMGLNSSTTGGIYYNSDSTHPTAIGNEILTRYWWSGLNQIVK